MVQASRPQKDGHTPGIPADVAEALLFTLQSPNVPDANMEPANIVDVVHRLANAVHNVAYAITTRDDIDRSADGKAAYPDPVHAGDGTLMMAVERVAAAIHNHTACQDGLHRIAEAGQAIAEAIGDLAAAVREMRETKGK